MSVIISVCFCSWRSRIEFKNTSTQVGFYCETHNTTGLIDNQLKVQSSRQQLHRVIVHGDKDKADGPNTRLQNVCPRVFKSSSDTSGLCHQQHELLHREN
ncbi:hypothetical protein E3U43_011518 [Larimichthys crocea]|uniref:Uncharacterized protein n=1 Tax=Larimichthys crocea TaxID=215358 RepID=A0ACD3QJR6_LARCR|nr:hypothetical protein E3U43_011518 [Larimichthys crocea]